MCLFPLSTFTCLMFGYFLLTAYYGSCLCYCSVVIWSPSSSKYANLSCWRVTYMFYSTARLSTRWSFDMPTYSFTETQRRIKFLFESWEKKKNSKETCDPEMLLFPTGMLHVSHLMPQIPSSQVSLLRAGNRKETWKKQAINTLASHQHTNEPFLPPKCQLLKNQE